MLPALAKAGAVKSAPNASHSATITLTFVLRRDDQSGFDRYLHDVYDSSSPHFRRFLSQPEIALRFGPSHAAYDGVLAYLRTEGFELVVGSSNRLTITVRGTRARTERAFAPMSGTQNHAPRPLWRGQTLMNPKLHIGTDSEPKD